MQNVVAATIAVGTTWHEVADIAAAAAIRHTGLSVRILDETTLHRSGLGLPHLLKFKLFDLIDADTILFFDADLIFIRDWDPIPYLHLPEIVCVRDRFWNAEIVGDACQFGVPPNEYFNSGMFIANRHHHSTWLKCAEECLMEHKSVFGEQGALNAARIRLNLGLKLLDRRFNSICHPQSPVWERVGAFAVHDAGEISRDSTLRLFRWMTTDLSRRPSPVDEFAVDALADKTYRIVIGANPARQLAFGSDGTLGRGSTEAARFWFVVAGEDHPILILANETQIYCELEPDGPDWRGTVIDPATGMITPISLQRDDDHARYEDIEQRVADEIIGQRLFQYSRIGYDHRVMEFLPQGRIGLGEAGCEQLWSIEALPDDSIWWVIFGREQETCRLARSGDGRWRGQWRSYERMNVVLQAM